MSGDENGSIRDTGPAAEDVSQEPPVEADAVATAPRKRGSGKKAPSGPKKRGRPPGKALTVPNSVDDGDTVTFTTTTGKTITVPKASPKAKRSPKAKASPRGTAQSTDATPPVAPAAKPLHGNVRGGLKVPDFVRRSRLPIQRAVDQPALQLKMAADPTRAAAILLIYENEEMNVNELCVHLDKLSQPALSHHLAILRHGRIVDPRRSGKSNFYSLTEIGRKLAETLLALCE